MLSKVLPFFLLFGTGVFYRRSGFFNFEDGRSLSKLVIYATLPCLAFVSFSQAQFTTIEILTLPALGLGIPIVLFMISLGISKKIKLEKKTLAIFLSSATVANLSFFLYPFFEIHYGKEGLAKLILFDLGNTISAYTLAYFIILRYGTEKSHSLMRDILNLMVFPPLWGIILGIVYGVVLSKSLFILPAYIFDFIARVGQSNSIIAMIVLGIYFSLKIRQPKAVVWAIIVRMLCGSAMGALFAWMLNLDGLAKLVAILAPGMPVGLSVIVYSVQQDLDSEFAVSLLSLSLLFGVIIVTFFMP